MALYFVTSAIVRPKRQTLEQTFAYFGELGQEMRKAYNALTREAFTVTADDGTRISCELVSPPHPTERPKIVIFVHGFGFTRSAAMKYLAFFQKRGYYAVLFDHRNCGESGGKFTTFGAQEHRDLIRIVDAVCDRFGADAVIGTVGESMGGATVLLHAAKDARVAFTVADCAYADCRAQLRFTLSKRARWLAPVLLPLADRMVGLRAHFRFADVSPERELAALKRPLPILFAHGTADRVVPFDHHDRLVSAYHGPKLTLIGQDSRHTRSAVDHPEQYDAAIGQLLALAHLE
ncbi:MAG: alpha/beta fold hydrolase [Clostridia bacterium]|nr:alpha/beta fold hydrolase [Clostridia bacterium]